MIGIDYFFKNKLVYCINSISSENKNNKKPNTNGNTSKIINTYS